ncbi:MAG: hypothetical protein ACRYGR_08090 [Janthinobacterium lividum]
MFFKILGLFFYLSHLGYGCDDFTIIEPEFKVDDLRHIHGSFYPSDYYKVSNCYKAIVFYNKTKSNPFFIDFIKRKQHQHNEAIEYIQHKLGNLRWDFEEQKFLIRSICASYTNIEKQKMYIIASLKGKTLKIKSQTIQGKKLSQHLEIELESSALVCSTFYNRIYIMEECD